MSQQSMFEQFPHQPDTPELIQSILELGYANLPSQVSSADCQELFGEFRGIVALCTEPGGQDIQDALKYSVNQRGNGDYFLAHRIPGTINPHESSQRAATTDHKYIYHHGPTSTRRAQAVLGTRLPAEMLAFLEKCDDTYSQGRSLARAVFRLLGVENVMFNQALVDDVHHLRLIDYVASDSDLLGEAHFDRSLATLAIDESDTGLVGSPGQNGYLLRYPEYAGPKEPFPTETDASYWHGDTMQPVEHQDKIVKFFLGAGVNRLKAHRRGKLDGLPLLGHGIQNDRPGQSRQAVVMFLNPHNQFKGYNVPSKFETGFGDIWSKVQKLAA